MDKELTRFWAVRGEHPLGGKLTLAWECWWNAPGLTEILMRRRQACLAS